MMKSTLLVLSLISVGISLVLCGPPALPDDVIEGLGANFRRNRAMFEVASGQPPLKPNFTIKRRMTAIPPITTEMPTVVEEPERVVQDDSIPEVATAANMDGQEEDDAPEQELQSLLDQATKQNQDSDSRTEMESDLPPEDLHESEAGSAPVVDEVQEEDMEPVHQEPAADLRQAYSLDEPVDPALESGSLAAQTASSQQGNLPSLREAYALGSEPEEVEEIEEPNAKQQILGDEPKPEQTKPSQMPSDPEPELAVESVQEEDDDDDAQTEPVQEPEKELPVAPEVEPKTVSKIVQTIESLNEPKKEQVEPTSTPRPDEADAQPAISAETSSRVEFKQPVTQKDFDEQVKNNKVMLEYCQVEDGTNPDELAIECTVKTARLQWALSKTVFLKYTTDEWKTSKEIQAQYIKDGPNDGWSDRYKATIIAKKQAGQKLRLQVRYTRNGMVTFNDTNDYSIKLD